MASRRQSHTSPWAPFKRIPEASPAPTSKTRCRVPNRICPLLGIVALALLLAAHEPLQGRAKGVQPGYFTVKPHEPLRLLEVDKSPAEYERVIDAKKYLEASAVSQAGAHPDLTVSSVLIVKDTNSVLDEEDVPASYVFQLPAGIVANFGAIPACTLRSFENTVYDNDAPRCSTASQVGVISALFGGQLPDRSYPLYKINIQNLYGTHGGHLAAIGFPYRLINDRVPVILRADLRSGGDYGMTLSGRSRLPEFIPAPFITLWGEPWAPSHDGERWDPETQMWGASVSEKPVPFITTSSDCSSGILEARLRLQYRFEPEHWLPDDPEDFAYRSFLSEPSGCETAEFGPLGEILPTTREPDSSTGLAVDLEVPRDDEGGLESAPLKNLSVTLPAGMSVNPATLNGMEGCTQSQIGLMDSNESASTAIHFALGEARCPDASKIGMGTADTPLAEGPVKVALYLATPYENPFHSLISVYVVLESLGFTIKLAAEVDADPTTGQLTAKMESLPQLPLERVDLKIFGGPRAPLANPVACGDGTVVAALVPWSAPESGPPRVVRSTLKFEQEGGGQGPCSDVSKPQLVAPLFTAGLRDVAAGGASSFILRVERHHGEQGPNRISLKVPKGVAPNLQGVSYCSDAAIATAERRDYRGGGTLEREEPSCPANSKVGSVLTGVGTGSIPLFSQGTVYLGGGYKGSPLSLVAITPAIAGGSAETPLVDLGTVVVRVALNVDQRTGQIAAISDVLPRMIAGIPLRIDDLRVLLDRDDFVRGPTSCNEMKVDAEIEGLEGAEADPTNRFQMGGCRHLRFRPRFHVEAKRDAAGPRGLRLRAVLTAGARDAHVSRATFTFPISSGRRSVRPTHVCSRPLFLNGSCPRQAIYGHADAWSPLLTQPVSGPIYAMSMRRHTYLVAALKGRVSLLAPAKMSSMGGRLRLTFSALPDLPLSRVRWSLRGGALGVSTMMHGACGRTPLVVARFTAHSGSVRTRRAIVRGLCADRSGRRRVRQSKPRQLGNRRG